MNAAVIAVAQKRLEVCLRVRTLTAAAISRARVASLAA